jgi:hypothetical protein
MSKFAKFVFIVQVLAGGLSLMACLFLLTCYFDNPHVADDVLDYWKIAFSYLAGSFVLFTGAWLVANDRR